MKGNTRGIIKQLRYKIMEMTMVRSKGNEMEVDMFGGEAGKRMRK